jgi:hypothetical protein
MVVTSPDGVDWEIAQSIDHEIWGITWQGGRFVAISSGAVATSPDGEAWQVWPIDIITAPWIGGVAWNGTRMVVLADYELYISEDLETWQMVPFEWELREVLWTGELWVVAATSLRWGEGSAFLVSRDAQEWEAVLIHGSGRWPHAAVWDGSAVLCVDYDGVLSWLMSDSTVVTVPAAAHLRGYRGSRWRTDLELHNPHGADAGLVVDLLERGQDNGEPLSASFTVSPQSSLALADVLDTAFSFHGAAALRIRPEGSPLLASSRTYDDAADGTYGQMVPALRSTDAIWSYESGRLIQLAHSPNMSQGYRTNIGLVSGCPEPMEVVVDLYLGSGELLGSQTASLDAYGSTQLNNALAAVTDEAVTDGFAILSTSAPRCSFFAYASVVDNRTNDPILVPARPWPVEDD